MKVSLHDRTEETVRIYFNETRDAEIKSMLPQKAKSEEEAVEDYRKTLSGPQTSYGRTIYADDEYVGDIWCYGLGEEDPDAMVSYCVFKKEYWGRGIAAEALRLFLSDIINIFALKSIGAFTYSSNEASIRVLEKNGFVLNETFEEDNIQSKYFLLQIQKN